MPRDQGPPGTRAAKRIQDAVALSGRLQRSVPPCCRTQRTHGPTFETDVSILELLGMLSLNCNAQLNCKPCIYIWATDRCDCHDGMGAWMPSQIGSPATNTTGPKTAKQCTHNTARHANCLKLGTSACFEICYCVPAMASLHTQHSWHHIAGAHVRTPSPHLHGDLRS